MDGTNPSHSTRIMKLQIKKKMPSALDRAHGKHSLCRVPWITAHGKRGCPNTYPLALVPTTHIEDPTVGHDQESAKRLTWHKMGTGYNHERLVHPSDAGSWTHFDGIHRQKADEACNVRVALATDGFNPRLPLTLVGPCSLSHSISRPTSFSTDRNILIIDNSWTP